MPDPIYDLAWPPTLDTRPDGRVTLRTVQQDSPESIRQGLAMACEVRPGLLPWDETFGTTDPAGSTDPALAAAQIAAELRAIDPRPAQIAVDVIEQDDGQRNLHLGVKTR
jgi:hypothetical protein